MKDILLDLSQCHGLGDLLSATPVIRKLFQAHQKKLTVVSPMPEVFFMNPCVEQSLPSRWFDVAHAKNEFLVYNSFHSIGQKNEQGVEMKHNMMDIRQFHAANLGFQLREDEMRLDFYCNSDEVWKKLHYDYTEAFDKPYIVIHPVNSWASRSWAHWQAFIDLFEESYPEVHIIALGKSSVESGFHHVNKDFVEITGKNLFDLRGKTTLAEAQCILSHAGCVFTVDSGLLHLAATTDAPIVQIGSSIHPAYRKVIRPVFKYQYVGGECTKFCASDMSYGVKEWGSIQGVPPLVGCLENYDTFKCHPSPTRVLHVFNLFKIFI